MGGSGEVAAAQAIYKWLTIYLEEDENQAFDEESPPTSLLSATYANITPILSLSSPSSSDEEEAVKAHTHIDKVIKIISVVVVYEQGVRLKSSITMGTTSRKDLTLKGCTKCPL